MSDTVQNGGPDAGAPGYVGWRAELLARLALSRLPGVDVFQPRADAGVDYVVAAADGAYFAVVVKAFSSIREGLRDPAAVPDMSWSLESQAVRRARASASPVVLFLFDADTEHGRYLRLDTLPEPAPRARSVPVKLPRENAIDRQSLGRLLDELRREERRVARSV